MVEVRTMLVCPERKLFWADGTERAKCEDAGHEHQRHETHLHREVVQLPDGTRVIAVSFDPMDPYARDGRPDYGLYLDQAWQPPWTHDHLDWPDFGVPADQETMITRLRALLDRARAGERVEIGCLGGHGRTGTALACLAVLTGHPATDAVRWVRSTYCTRAVETAEQQEYVAGFR